VRCEHLCTDIVVYDPTCAKVIAVEVELSDGNLLRNEERNRSSSADNFLILRDHPVGFVKQPLRSKVLIISDSSNISEEVNYYISALRSIKKE
ncbi:MAG: hypothetical protein AB3N10_16945, partial [Allomuricauda sp.]